MERRSSNAALFWPVVVGVVVADVITKLIASRALLPTLMPREVFGEWMRFTLVYNKGAAFGLNVGPYSRWFFLVLTLAALYILGRLYQSTRPGNWSRVLAIALVCGGALGTLYDRVRHGMGVVDFIDLGVGDWRWPTFNVADVAVSFGAFLLAWALWGEDQVQVAQSAEPQPIPTGSPGGGD